MHGAKLRLIGLTLLSGAGIAVGCGGDDSGGGSGNNDTGTPTTNTVTTTITTGSATSSQSTNNTVTSTSTSTGTTGTGTGTTGAGGGGGDSGCTDEDPPVGTTGSAGEGGGAGADTSGGEAMGWNFVDESELEDFNDIEACDGCNVTVGWACGVMEVTVEWAGANEASQVVNISNTLPEDMLRDMSGATIVMRARMTSDQVDNNGYDFKVFAQDFGDGSDWDWFDTTHGSTDRPEGEAFSPADIAESMLPLSLAPSDFSTNMVRKMGIQIASKWWQDIENPENNPTFDYTTTTFEIDYLAW